jgi:hypothetical protein
MLPISSRKYTRYKESVIYFIYAPDHELIKIGHSVNFEQRFRDLKTMMPFVQLICLKLIPGTSEDEREIHKRFNHLRIPEETGRFNTEWFRADPELLAFIDVEDPKEEAKERAEEEARKRLEAEVKEKTEEECVVVCEWCGNVIRWEKSEGRKTGICKRCMELELILESKD